MAIVRLKDNLYQKRKFSKRLALFFAPRVFPYAPLLSLFWGIKTYGAIFFGELFSKFKHYQKHSFSNILV